MVGVGQQGQGGQGGEQQEQEQQEWQQMQMQGNHLRVLLDAGAVARRRSGRHVLYWRTALGESLIAADGP